MARVLVERRSPGASLELTHVAGEGPSGSPGSSTSSRATAIAGVEELDLARPRWREDPALPLAVVANYLGAVAGSGPDAVERRLAAEREAVSARIATRLGPLRRWLFRQVLGFTQKLSVARQNSKSVAMRVSALSRRAALELGRRLADEGRIASADDIFSSCASASWRRTGARGADLGARVAERRRDHSAWERETPPALIDADGRAVREPSLAGRGARAGQAKGPVPSDSLTGIGSSPGKARGPVRVVHDTSRGVRIEPGEILVAPYTDPAWTPLFLSAGAVVVEIGSLPVARLDRGPRAGYPVRRRRGGGDDGPSRRRVGGGRRDCRQRPQSPGRRVASRLGGCRTQRLRQGRGPRRGARSRPPLATTGRARRSSFPSGAPRRVPR